jgi:O-antigen/teichoic acid export membrane protein
MLSILIAALKTGAGTLGMLLSGAIAIKVFARILGPAGVGLFSLLRQVQQTGSILGSCGGQQALTQGISSRTDQERSRFILTSGWFFLVGSMSIVAIMILGAAPIARATLGRGDGQSVLLIRLLSLPILLGSASAYFSGVLNGFREIGRLAAVQVTATSVLAILAYPTARLVQNGYASAFVWVLAIALLASGTYAFWACWKSSWRTVISTLPWILFDRFLAIQFASVAGTTLFTSLMTSGTVLIIRAMIVHKNGLASAGMFDVAWTISVAYVMLVLTTFNTFYLPTLAGTASAVARIILIKQLLRFANLAIVPLVLAVIVLKPLVVRTLYSAEFVPALSLVRWMLLGDYLKVASWVLAIPMLAFADMKSYFWSELLSNVLLLVLSSIAIFKYTSLQGIGVAVCILYVVYLVFTAIYSSTVHEVRFSRSDIWHWLVGLILVASASFNQWNAINVDWIMAPIWGVVGIGFVIFSVRMSEWRLLAVKCFPGAVHIKGSGE